MARKAAVMGPVGEAPAKPAGLPVQTTSVDVWPILADHEQAIREIASGQHDEYIRFLEHVCRSQGKSEVLAACWKRIESLEK